MHVNNRVRIRIYMGENDKFEGKPLYEAIVLAAKERNLHGATVYLCMMGFGANSFIHTTKILRLSEDLPIVVEIIDYSDSIDSFVQVLSSMFPGGFAVKETVEAIEL